MKSVTITGLDDEVLDRVAKRAEAHNRSVEAELRSIVTKAVYRISVEELFERAGHVAAMTPDVPQTDSTTIVRQMRDERGR